MSQRRPQGTHSGKVLITLVGLLISGCAADTYRYTRGELADGQWDRDVYECQRDVAYVQRPGTGAPLMETAMYHNYVDQMFERCMRARGYAKE